MRRTVFCLTNATILALISNTSLLLAEDQIYRTVTDRVMPIEPVPIRRDSNASSPVVTFAAKGEQLHYRGVLVPGKWIPVTKMNGARQYGYVLADKLESGESTDYMRRVLPKGVVEIKIKGMDDFDSNGAVFFNGRKIGPNENYSGLGTMWVQGDHVIVSAGGHAGNSAEWCDLFDFQGGDARYLGPSSCLEPAIKDNVLSWTHKKQNKDTENTTVSNGVYAIETIPYEKPDFKIVKDVKGGRDVTRWNQKSPFDVLEDITEQKRLRRILNEAEFDVLSDMFQMSSPCELKAGYLICTGFKKGQSEFAGFAVSVSTGNPYAFTMSERQEPRLYGGKLLPAPLQEWLVDQRVQNLPATWLAWNSKDPINDRPEFTAVLKPSATGSFKVVMRCKSGASELFISTDDYLGSSVPLRVIYRVGKLPAVDSIWSPSSQGKAAFFPGNDQAFMDALPPAGGLFVRLYDFRGVSRDGNFDLSGVDSVRQKISSTCKVSAPQ